MKANQEQARFFLPFVQALAEGKKVETRTDVSLGWISVDLTESDWFTTGDYTACVQDKRYFRIVEPPKLRPWKPEEVPVGAILRGVWGKAVLTHTEGSGETMLFCAPDGSDKGRKWYVCQSNVIADMNYSTDGGKTWKPCGVEE